MNAFTNFPTAKALMLGLGLCLAHHPATWAQTIDTGQQPAVGQGITDSKTIEAAIAPYRDDVRRSVLLASQQPQVLTQLAQQQANSQQAFNELIEPFGQTKQGWFYDLARFPDLLHALAQLPARSDRPAVDAVTSTLPADLQETAWKLYRHHNAELVQADNLNQQAAQSFNALLAPLDVPTQAAFQQLIEMPDVLTLLTQQLDKTTQLGQTYQADPVGVTQHLTALHDSLTAQNQQELADYQRELNQDPQAQQELQQASQAYAQANGYNTNGINPNPAWVNSSYYYQNPYSYWFGYPYWYGSPLWYPSAWWSNTGFYYGLGGNMVVFGLPSMGFSHWFFNRGYGAYPHLYNRFNNYYARNVGGHRYWAAGNSGFMSAARRAFNPTVGVGGRGNWLTNPRQYSRSNNGIGSYPNARMSAPVSRYPSLGAGAYHGQSWGGSFGGSRAFGGAGFRGGRR